MTSDEQVTVAGTHAALDVPAALGILSQLDSSSCNGVKEDRARLFKLHWSCGLRHSFVMRAS